MKKLSFKWKLFLIISYLQLASFGYMLFRLVYTSFTLAKFREENSIYIVAFFFAIAIVCLDNFLNIYVIHRYFPDTALPEKNKSFMKITGILHGIVWLALLFVCVAGIQSETPVAVSNNNKNLIVFSILGFLWLTGLFSLILQPGIPALLKKNYTLKMKELIDAIGAS